MIQTKLLHVQEQIHQAARTAGTDLRKIRLIAVTKTVEEERILEALQAGVTEIGENRVQELVRKAPTLAPLATLHLIGHLQTNKVKEALRLADYIHSVDSLHLASEVQKQAQKLNKQAQILLQVNTSGEESKFGVSPEELFFLAEEVLKMPNVKIRGLMTIAPKTETPELVRPFFAETRKMYERMAETFLGDMELDMLSMGMSNDYVEAILEGATVVRIGRGIFGERI